MLTSWLDDGAVDEDSDGAAGAAGDGVPEIACCNVDKTAAKAAFGGIVDIMYDNAIEI